MREWELICSIKAVPKKLKVEIHNYSLLCNKDIPKEILERLLLADPFGRHIVHSMDNDEYFIVEKYDRCHWIAYHVDKLVAENLLAESGQQTFFKADGTFRSSLLDHYGKNFKEFDFNDLLKLWNDDPRQRRSDCPSAELLMRPPDFRGHSRSQSYPQTLNGSNASLDVPASFRRKEVAPKENIDPREYINLKYYELLFSLGTALAYFVKSNLVRFTNLCRAKYGENYKLELQTILLSMILNIGEFNKRYSSGFGILTEESTNSYLVEARDSLISRYNLKVAPTTTTVDKESSENSNKKRISDSVMLIKAREIKLQIVLLLEVIRLNRLDNNFKNFDGRYKGKLKGRSRNVLRKNFVWGKLRPHTKSSVLHFQKESQDQSTVSVDFCEELDLYLDQLAILELMLDFDPVNTENNNSTKSRDIPETEDVNYELERYLTGLKKKNEESSAVGFTNYVLIPYYSKRVPYAVRFIVNKIKGPNMRATTTRRSTKMNDDKAIGLPLYHSFSFSSTSTLNPDISSLASFSSRPSFSRQSSTHSSQTLSSEALAAKTNSNLSEFLQIDSSSFRNNPATLTRAYSDINNLQKRELKIISPAAKQIDLKASETQPISSTAVANRGSETGLNTQRSFRRVGKPKNLANSGPHKFFSFKNSKNYNVNDLNNNNDDLIQVLATPAVKRDRLSPVKKLELREVVESPLIASLRKSSPSIDTKGPQSANRYRSAFATSPQLRAPVTPVQVFATPALKRSGQKVTSLEKIVEDTPLGAGGTSMNVCQPNTKLESVLESKPAPTKKVRRRLFGP